MSDNQITIQPEESYKIIRNSVLTAQEKVYTAVNSAMVQAYWEIGQEIHKACGENDRAEYGKKLLEYGNREFLDAKIDNEKIITVKAYDGIADFCYRKIKKGDFITISGNINDSFEIVI